jgi:hypothetical protein
MGKMMIEFISPILRRYAKDGTPGRLRHRAKVATVALKERWSLRQGLMTSGNLNTVPAMGRTTLTCWFVALGSRSK